MRFAGNVIWFVLGGWLAALLWLLGALIFAISIVGLPLTRSAIEMAKLSAWPFGREVVHVRELDGRGLDAGTAVTGTIGFVANIIWALTFGLALCLSYILLGILYCITLIGIPFGMQAFKLAGISLWPVGRRVVTAELADLARREAAAERFTEYRRRRGARGERAGREPVLSAPAGSGRLREHEPVLLHEPPPEAPPKAPNLPPQLAADRGWFVEVVGEASCQSELQVAAASSTQAYEGKPLVMVTLEPEEDNRHDRNAVRVDWKGSTLGYLPRASAKEYRSTIGARRAACSGLIHQGEDEAGRLLHMGIWLNAAWPPRFK